MVEVRSYSPVSGATSDEMETGISPATSSIAARAALSFPGFTGAWRNETAMDSAPSFRSFSRLALYGLHVQGSDHLAIHVDAFGGLGPQLPGNKRLGHLLVQVVEVEALLAADLDDVREPLCGDEARARALSLDQRVGDEGGGVNDAREAGRFKACGLQYVLKTCKRALRWVIGRGQYLGDMDRAARLVNQHEVGERAPDVYP